MVAPVAARETNMNWRREVASGREQAKGKEVVSVKEQAKEREVESAVAPAVANEVSFNEHWM